MVRLPQLTSRLPGRPWTEFDTSLRRLVNEFVEGFETRLPRAMVWAPVVELTESEDELVLTAELPGMTREDVEVELVEDVLTIRGEKKEEREEKKPQYHLWERSYGKFQRSFTLPRPVDAAKITAQVKNGVLTIRVPKTAESKARRIEIAGA